MDEFVDRRARELASDPTLNVALEASAGTGKTRILVDRYLKLLEEGSSPRHVLAITFTRKAAFEMKTRIIEELRKRPELWAEIRTRLFEMHVTTIDAFCLGLLREFPLEAGLEPDVALIDEVESDRLKEEAIAETLAASRSGTGVDIRFLVARFGEGALHRGMRDFLSSRLVKEDILDRYVEHVVPASVGLESSLKRVSEALAGAFGGGTGVTRFLETGPENEAPGFRAFRFALERVVDPAKIAPIDVEEIKGYFLTARNEPRRRLSRVSGNESFPRREDYERHRDRVLGLAPLVARAYRQWIREKDFYAVRQIHALYREAAAKFRDSKRARAALDFTDVLVEAVRLLERRGEFSQSRFRLESRYHHLLIDEFQDTNEFQWRLIRALVDSWGEGSGLVQEVILAEQAHGRGEGRIQEPSLFLVGDRKQSIYGWRDARVEVMEKASRHLLGIRPNGGRKLSLRHSFRASGELLSFLNDVFSELPKVRSDLEWSFQYRESDHFPISSDSKVFHPVALAVAPDLRSVASAVADEVVRILKEEGRRPKDVAILFRSRASYRPYEEALLERGVPAYVYRGLGFFDSSEVMDLRALVRFLAEPASELRAAELARSRFVAISDSGLMRLAAARGRSSSDSPLSRWLSTGAVDPGLPLTADDRAAVSRASELLPLLLKRVDRIPPADLLERIIQESDYASWFSGERQGWENLKKVLEMVRRAQNRGYLTMSRLADFLERASTDEESTAVLEAVDAVNLMTIHAAKGLEFDSVFLVNMHQKGREDTSLPRIREHADGRIEVSALAAASDEDAAHLELQASRVEEEEKRLLYVAMTRARRNLGLSAVVPGPEGSVLKLLPEGLRSSFEEAVESKAPDVSWGQHVLRILRPAEGRSFEREEPVREERLRLEPLSPDALEGSVNVLPDSPTIGQPIEVPGEVHRRLPFSLDRGGSVLRGVIDYLVVNDRAVTVAASERGQLEVLLEVAAALFPGRDVRGIVVSNGVTSELRREEKGDSSGQLELF
jgi:ATP-dependent helicase/nuclease subunit A